MASAVRVVEPSVEPISLTEAKAHLRVTSSAEDALITALIVAARTRVEEEVRRALITQTWELTLDWIDPPNTFGQVTPTVLVHPTIIELPRPPLQSVSYVTYLNGDEDTVYMHDTVGSPELTSGLVIDTSSSPGRIIPASGAAWPAVFDQIGAVTIRYVAGYGATSASVPGPLKQAILLLLSHLFQHREAATEMVGVSEMPLGVCWLLEPYRVLAIA